MKTDKGTLEEALRGEGPVVHVRATEERGRPIIRATVRLPGMRDHVTFGAAPRGSMADARGAAALLEAAIMAGLGAGGAKAQSRGRLGRRGRLREAMAEGGTHEG